MEKKERIAARAATIIMIEVLLSLPCAAQHATHSVLRSGQWVKIAVGESGVYRLTAAEAGPLAISAVADLALYGGDGGVLNERNGESRTDDLREIPVEVQDNNNNGLFDEGDLLLFYATGPDRWDYDEELQRYRCTTHPYSRYNYLYLTASSGTHRRVVAANEGSADGEAVATCHALVRHEADMTNTHKSGQKWVGERFYGGGTQHIVTLALPAAPTGELKVNYALASLSTTSSRFTVTMGSVVRECGFSRNDTYKTLYETFVPDGSSTLQFIFNYQYGESLAAGYLDYVEVDATVPMTMSGTQTLMYLPAQDAAVHPHHVAATAGDARIWEVTDPYNTVEMTIQRNGSSLVFNRSTQQRRTYIAFSATGARPAVSVEVMANQDLHGATNPDMVIVSHSSLTEAAQRLATVHSLHDGMEVLAVSQDEVFNEFSSGQTDPTAIREMLRMFRKRSQADSSLRTPRYLLLLGKGTYDNKNLLDKALPTVVTYQTPASFDDDGGSLATDDFFTFLDDGECGTMFESLDISVGRLPAKSSEEADHIIDKIERYITRSDLQESDIRGDWRNCVALLADDADPSSPNDTIFTNSSEITARQIEALHPQYTIDKIYADAYVQQSGADGSFYPDVNNALKKRMDYGCLLLNYIGHGSSQYIGTERYMMKSNISNYANVHQLPFFMTSTCTFGRYDDPEETCGAEEFLLADGAGIGCLAASRPISHVQATNTEMVMLSLDPRNAIGDAIRIAKNNRATAQALTLMGDPALRLSFPKYHVVVTAVNGRPVVEGQIDSATVLSTVTIEGEIRDDAGHRVEDFDGVLYPEVYDRPVTTHTQANDNEGCEVRFSQQNSLLYKGHTTVSQGRFSYHFTVPRDVAYKYDAAKLCHYAKGGGEDATGAYTNLYLGGFNENANLGETRPDIRLFVNDTNFRDGGITDDSPTLLAVLYDSVGINAVGSGLGHDITALLDGNPNNLIILNDFYEADIEDDHRGHISYNFSGLTPGRHTLTVKAWNIYNYSNSATLTFYVHGSDTTTTTFLAYPNPAGERVWLHMEHNLKGRIADAEVQIYDMRGERVRTIGLAADNGSYVVGPVEWDLRSDGGMRVGPGIYIARFLVSTTDGERLSEQGKIVVK